jgi:cell division protein FtsL
VYLKKYKKSPVCKGGEGMSSFIEENSNILNGRKSQYNRNTAQTASSGSQPRRSANTSQRRNSDEIIAEALERRRRYVKRRNEKFAKENSVAVRKALACGPEKINYSYDEYTVSEKSIPFGFLAVALALTLVAIFLLLNYSQISKYNTKINNIKSDIASYQEETKQLSILLDKNCDFEKVEAFAKKNGMIGSEQIESYYISMADSFKIENTADEEEDGYIISTVMSGFIELFSEVLGKE